MAKDNTNSKVNSNEDEQKIRQALHYSVGEICKEECSELEVEFSKAAMQSIAELAYRQAEIFLEDARHFAKHARRKKVGCEDVILLARRSDKLQQHLRQFTK